MYHFLSFYIVVSKCKEWKEKAFNGRPRATVSIATRHYATAVEHAVGYYLAGSKCKPNSGQTSITPIGLNIFFFASTREPRAKFLKLVFDWVSKFGWLKLVTILLFKFQNSAFVFYISKFVTC